MTKEYFICWNILSFMERAYGYK